jgi:hypothetical protein
MLPTSPAAPTPTPIASTPTPSSGPQGDWQELTPTLDFLPQGLVGNSIGYLAYGMALGSPTGDNLEGLFNLGLAVSTDGVSWAPVHNDAFANTLPIEAAALNGRFVLITGGASGYGAWVSDDGLTWNFHPMPVGDQDTVSQVASGASGFLAAGDSFVAHDDVAAAWFSPDGTTWSSVSAPPVEQIEDVAPYGGGFVALGSQRDTITYERATYSAWQTIDGTSWQPLGVFPDQVCCTPMAVAANGAAAVAVGGGNCEDSVIGAAWYYATDSDAWRRATHTADLDGSALWTVQPFDGGYWPPATGGPSSARCALASGPRTTGWRGRCGRC